jgi:hypothetical protein
MEGYSYCQHNCKIKIMNSLNYVMLTTRYLLLPQSFRQEETIIELLLVIKHIMQVGENSVLLGYCALPLGVHCLVFWEHVMASSSTGTSPISSLDHSPLKMRPLQSLKILGNNTHRQSKIFQKTEFSSAPLQSLKTHVTFKCVPHIRIHPICIFMNNIPLWYMKSKKGVHKSRDSILKH